MGEMIERVARAIAESIAMAQMRHNLREIGQEDQIENYLRAFPLKVTLADTDAARAAIEAMREPSDEMCVAIYSASIAVERVAIEAEEAWSAMIDAALGRGGV